MVMEDRELLDFILRKRSPLPPTTDTVMHHPFMATEIDIANTSTKGPETDLEGTGVLPQPQHQIVEPTDPHNIH